MRVRTMSRGSIAFAAADATVPYGLARPALTS